MHQHTTKDINALLAIELHLETLSAVTIASTTAVASQNAIWITEIAVSNIQGSHGNVMILTQTVSLHKLMVVDALGVCMSFRDMWPGETEEANPPVLSCPVLLQ